MEIQAGGDAFSQPVRGGPDPVAPPAREPVEDVTAWVSFRDAVTQAGCTERTLRRWIKSGKVESRVNAAGHREIQAGSLPAAEASLPVAVLSNTDSSLSRQDVRELKDELLMLRRQVQAVMDVIQEQKALPAPARPWWKLWG